MHFSNETVAQWREAASSFLTAYNLTPDDIKSGRDAWTVASRAGITQHAYEDRAVKDGHIQTALQRVFPNAVFKDKKVY